MTSKTTPTHPLDQFTRDGLKLQRRFSDIDAATGAIEASGHPAR